MNTATTAIAVKANVLMTSALAAALALAAGCSKDDKVKPEAKPEVKPEVKNDPEPTPPTNTAGAGGLAEAAGAYDIDTGHSAVVFRVKHMEVSYTYGMFTKVSGSFTLDADPSKSSVSVEVATDSVFTAVKDRDDHLRGPDFFEAKQFPKITFKSTAIKSTGENSFDVTGDLTLHGTTKPVTAKFELVGAGPSMMDKNISLAGVHGTLSIKRSEFGMSNMVGPAGDEVDLMIAIEGARK